MARPPRIIEQVIEVSQDYLGPAADRFIERQITTHLRKKPGSITGKDLDKLIDWIMLSFALLTDKDRLVDDYVHRLQLIARGEGQEALSDKWNQS